ncbi:MAG: hypothetical protein U0905_00650 [Pirellulales bacterium]
MASPLPQVVPSWTGSLRTRTPAVPVGPPQYLPVTQCCRAEWLLAKRAHAFGERHSADADGLLPTVLDIPVSGIVPGHLLPSRNAAHYNGYNSNAYDAMHLRYELQAQRVPMVTLHPTWIKRRGQPLAKHGSIASRKHSGPFELPTVQLSIDDHDHASTRAVLTLECRQHRHGPRLVRSCRNGQCNGSCLYGQAIRFQQPCRFIPTRAAMAWVLSDAERLRSGYSMGTGSLTTPGLSAPLNSSPYNGSVMLWAPRTAPPTSGVGKLFLERVRSEGNGSALPSTCRTANAGRPFEYQIGRC